jgi:plastocyanin
MNMKIKTNPFLAAVFALLMISQISLVAAESKPGPNAVTIDNFSFTPQTLTVTVGTKVTWTNKDDVPHTVTSTDKQFGSRALDTDEKFSFTFSTAGTYNYYCSVHPRMLGKVIVQAAK